MAVTKLHGKDDLCVMEWKQTVV